MKKLLIALLVIVAALGCAFGGGAYYYNSHVMPKTTLNGIDISNMEKEQVYSIINDELAAYKITITERDFTEELADLGLHFDQDTVNALIEEPCYTWVQSYFTQNDHTIDYVYDEAQILEKVSTLKCFTEPVSPTDAKLIYTDEHYEITPETYGYEPADAEASKQKVLATVLSLADSVDLTDGFVEPTVHATDSKIVKAYEKAQSYMDLGIYYKFGKSKEKITNDIMHDFIKIKNFKVTMKEDKITEYVQSLADKYDTCYTQRNFKTHSGSTITIKRGSYGWWTNTADSATALLNKIKAKEGGKAEIVYRQTAGSYEGNDYGDTYVEVSIKAQTLWLYKDGKCILSTPVTTGNPNKGNATPTGIYAITYKTTDHRMVGEDYDVMTKYWMPFCGNVGLHDATWRSTFGHAYYLTSGSHGCVNIPLGATRTIFNTVSKFTAVILY